MSNLHRLGFCLSTVLAASPVAAHSWYQGQINELGELCCGGKDCGPDLVVDDVEERPGGFWIKSLNVFVPETRAKPSPEDDGYYHVCRWGGEIKCFFYPQRGY